MTSYHGHGEECICIACMKADFEAFTGESFGEIEKTEAVPTRSALGGQNSGRGTVRTISDRQVRFITKLIRERDTSNLHLLPGQFIDAVRIPTMGVKGGSALIEKLLACPMKSGAVAGPKMASEKQAAFLTKLLAERVTSNMANAEGIVPEKTTAKDASMLINFLLGQPRKPVAEIAKAEELVAGMYRLDGVIYKVQRAVHGSGNLYAKRLVVEGGEGSFEYAAGMICKLRPEHKLTLEEAKEFGALYGVCCVCSATLTDEKSIAAGIGPVCAGKF